MKTCARCRRALPEDNYNWKIKGKRRQSYCIECQADYRKLHYEASKEYYKDKAQKWKLEQRKIFYEWLLDKSCIDCGVSDIRVLEFDHLGDDKEYNIAQKIGQIKLEVLIEEINKCDIVCANCHRIRTAERGNWYKYMSL